MQILRLKDWNNPSTDVIDEAVEVLQRGGVVVYPADTAGYSLGASALNEEAIRKVFLIKKRPFSMPMNIVVKDSTMAKKLCYWKEVAQKLADKFLPGALTLILNKKPILPKLLTAGLKTVGIRIPDSPVALQISQKSQLPFTITTANISGRGISSFSLEEVLDNFGEQEVKPDLIIDAGELPDVPPSTIVDLSSYPLRVLRKGPVTVEELRYALGEGTIIEA